MLDTYIHHYKIIKSASSCLSFTTRLEYLSLVCADFVYQVVFVGGQRLLEGCQEEQIMRSRITGGLI